MKGTVVRADADRAGGFYLGVKEFGEFFSVDARALAEGERWFGRLTLADLAVGKTVYLYQPENVGSHTFRGGDSPTFYAQKIPGAINFESRGVFPASACAGLRD